MVGAIKLEWQLNALPRLLTATDIPLKFKACLAPDILFETAKQR